MLAPQTSFPSTQRKLRDTSPIAAEARRLNEHVHSPSAQKERDEKIQNAYKKRLALVQQFQNAGLAVSAVKFKGDDRESLVYEDLSSHDDGGKLIEAFLHVPAFTKEQVRQIYDIAEQNQLGVMTVGAKTSALGVFSAGDVARMRGLKGVICLDMPACWDANQNASTMEKTGMPDEMKSLKPIDLLQLPEVDRSKEKLLVSENLPIAVLENIDESAPEKKHRIIAHSTVTVAQINAFLSEVLPKDAHYQILPDLTSKEQASLGGVIATGAQGGNRTSARVDLLSCQVVDALGTRDLKGEDAKLIVGYNGYLGTCVQAEFEVTKFPKHPFGFMVPIRGSTVAEAWQNALKFQSRLAPHCVHPDQLKHQADGLQKTLISSMEILGPEQLRLGIDKYKGRTEDLKVLLEQYSGTQIYVYVTGSTHLDQGGDLDLEGLLKDSVFAQSLQTQTGPEDDLAEAFDGSLIKVKDADQLPHQDVYPLLEPELLKLVDAIRHSAPEVARAEAEKIGNVTQSTDFNIQFTGTAEEQECARAKVAALYAKYQERFSKGQPYRVDVYGHLYPGIVSSPKGGGMDPHIRITLNLSDPDTRNDSPERVNEMKSILSTFYTDLLRLHGTDGIVVAPPEKSHLTNLSYVKWVRLHNPGMMKRLQERFFGDLSKEGRSRRLLGGFRVPVEFPMEPRRGMKSFLPAQLLPPADQAHLPEAYGDAILEICQLSHRGPEMKGMFREVVATLREKLKLHEFRQHPFFIESVEEGRKIIERNVGAEFPVQEITSAIDFQALEEEPFDANTFYLVPAEHLGGMPGMCVMVTPHKALLKADERKRRGENKEVFRNLVELFQYYPYETPETPNIPGVAYLGLSLQKEELARQSSEEADRVVTINPGPTQLHPRVRKVVREQGLLQSQTPEDQQLDIEAFRAFMKMPKTMKLGFTGSATQCMQLFGEALAQRKNDVHLVQVVNGAFSERMQKILGSHGLDVSTLRTPWTTSENSQVEFVANELVRRIDEGVKKGKKPILFVTPHKTATTAHFHPESLVAQLKQRSLELAKDYELVCDITSGAGAIDYFTETCQEGMSVFGSDQKALGCPAGLGFFGLSQEMAKLLVKDDVQENGITSSVKKAEKGEVQNAFALRMLGEKCVYELSKERTVVNVQEETRKKVETVLGFMALHPDLCYQVPSAEDQSPLLVGLYSITHNLPVAFRLMDEIFGYRIGAGYGPFAQESGRLYLPTIETDDLDLMLSALHVVLEMPEVVKTVNPKAPLVSLREPHDPLQVLKHMVTSQITPDDIFRNNLGLGWIRRLQYTLELGKDTPYGSDENFDEIRKILDTRLHGRKDLLGVYEILEAKIDHLRDILMYGDEIRLRSVDALIADMYRDLGEIILILERYAKTAPRTPDGRIKWPLAGTPEQFRKGNGNGNGSNGNGKNGVH